MVMDLHASRVIKKKNGNDTLEQPWFNVVVGNEPVLPRRYTDLRWPVETMAQEIRETRQLLVGTDIAQRCCFF